MITERDIDQAIAECRADRDPDAWTCMRLAAFLTIKAQLFGNPEQLRRETFEMPMIRGASMAEGPQTSAEEIVEYESGTEFGKAIDGKRAAQIWPVLDEAMSILQTMHPKLYNAIIKRL